MTVDWRGPGWLKPFFGDAEDTIFHRVTALHLSLREVPDSVMQLRHLETVQLDRTSITNDQLRRLTKFPSMNALTVEGIDVTSETVEMVIALRASNERELELAFRRQSQELERAATAKKKASRPVQNFLCATGNPVPGLQCDASP